MISEPDPDDDGTKISVSWKLPSRSHLHSFPAEHNSSWFSWITHVQREKGANQGNRWRCIISLKVVPFLLQKGCLAFYPLSAAPRVFPSLPASPLKAVWSQRKTTSWRVISRSEVIYYSELYYQLEIQFKQWDRCCRNTDGSLKAWTNSAASLSNQKAQSSTNAEGELSADSSTDLWTVNPTGSQHIPNEYPTGL